MSLAILTRLKGLVVFRKVVIEKYKNDNAEEYYGLR